MFNRTYFAHPVTDYNTVFEQRLVELLKETFNVIENPNQQVHDVGYKQGGMNYFSEKVLPLCDSCVFLAFPGGQIGAGVVEEIVYFLNNSLPVFEFNAQTGELTQFSSTDWLDANGNTRILDVDETRLLIKALKCVENGGRKMFT